MNNKMSLHDAEFWRQNSEYQHLAETYERNITRYHPGFVTSDRLSPWCYYCSWGSTCVDYYRYDGPDVLHI